MIGNAGMARVTTTTLLGTAEFVGADLEGNVEDVDALARP